MLRTRGEVTERAETELVRPKNLRVIHAGNREQEIENKKWRKELKEEKTHHKFKKYMKQKKGITG